MIKNLTKNFNFDNVSQLKKFLGNILSKRNLKFFRPEFDFIRFLNFISYQKSFYQYLWLVIDFSSWFRRFFYVSRSKVLKTMSKLKVRPQFLARKKVRPKPGKQPNMAEKVRPHAANLRKRVRHVRRNYVKTWPHFPTLPNMPKWPYQSPHSL